MNTWSRWIVLAAIILGTLLPALPAQENPSPPASAATDPSPSTADLSPPVEAPAAPTVSPARGNGRRSGANRRVQGNAVVRLNRDAFLAADTRADAVVSVGGSSTALGDVDNAVVSILGDSRAEGRVGDAVVSIFGNTYVNGRARDAIAVFGGVELGPDAVVENVVAVGGPLKRHAGAQITGDVNEVGFLRDLPDFTGFRSWVRNGLFWLRPLAVAPAMEWAWMVALTLFATYLVIALVFRRGVERCVTTLEERPGRTLLAALISLLLTPVVLILLSITVVGPLLGLAAMTLAFLFGKTAILGWLGRRVLPNRREAHEGLGIVLAVLIGGVLLTALYLVPLLGLTLWTLSTMMAFGVVIYTLLLGSRRTAASVPLAAAPTMTPPTATFATEPASAMEATSFRSPTMGSTFVRPAGDATPGSFATGFKSAPEVAFTGATQSSPESPLPPPLSQQGVPPPVSRPVPPVLPVLTYPRASFWLRTAALALDLVVVGAVSAFMSGGSLFLLLLAGYGAVMWKLKGTTIGGIVCGLKVVRIDDRPLDWTTAIVRALGCFLSLFVFGLGFLWVLFDPDRQSWHDKIAGTVVVRLPAGASLV